VKPKIETAKLANVWQKDCFGTGQVFVISNYISKKSAIRPLAQEFFSFLQNSVRQTRPYGF
jgi:hypothetical protein